MVALESKLVRRSLGHNWMRTGRTIRTPMYRNSSTVENNYSRWWNIKIAIENRLFFVYRTRHSVSSPRFVEFLSKFQREYFHNYTYIYVAIYAILLIKFRLDWGPPLHDSSAHSSCVMNSSCWLSMADWVWQW